MHFQTERGRRDAKNKMKKGGKRRDGRNEGRDGGRGAGRGLRVRRRLGGR